jgi:hypothetical protein
LPHETVDDGARQPATPDVGDYVDFDAGADAVLILEMGTRVVDSVSEIRVWVHYTVQASVGETSEVIVDIAPGGVFTGSVVSVANVGDVVASEWGSGTFTGLSLAQSDLDDLLVRVQIGGATDVHRIDAVYVEITYTGGSSARRTVPMGYGFGVWGPPPVF